MMAKCAMKRNSGARSLSCDSIDAEVSCILRKNKKLDIQQYQNYSTKNFRFAFQPGSTAATNVDTDYTIHNNHCVKHQAFHTAQALETVPGSP